MRQLGNPNGSYTGDTGEADPQVREALAGVVDADPDSYARAVSALGGARLLLPIAPDPSGDLSAVRTTASDGRTGLLAFTGQDSLLAWDRSARPVPCTLDEVAATAVETGSAAIVVDLAGPATLIIEAGLIEHLAKGRRLMELPQGGFGWVYLDGEGDHPHP